MSPFLDIHILQTVPPSNVNRDDTGSPKTAVYGGMRRARVSSQAWKNAVRKKFPELLDSGDLGQRTRRVADLLAQEITRQAPDLEAQSQPLAEGVFAALKIKLTAPKRKDDAEMSGKESGYLLFLSNNQVHNLADYAIRTHREGSKPVAKTAKALADTTHSIDVALFGRMVAEDTDINVDACAQVAHALSVHPVDNEYDYFTAMDDLPLPEQAGAGMIGTVEFNSSTLYRYATVDVARLEDVLGDREATSRALGAFVEAFITTMPTGKQNTFANRTLPDAVVVQVRSAQPVNLVGAFESAITERHGRIATAAKRLSAHSSELADVFGAQPEQTWILAVGAAREQLVDFGEQVTLSELVSAVRSLPGAPQPA